MKGERLAFYRRFEVKKWILFQPIVSNAVINMLLGGWHYHDFILGFHFNYPDDRNCLFTE
jgi:hypothetical protein